MKKQNKVHNGLIAVGIDPPLEEVVNNVQQSVVESIGFRKLNPRKPQITNEIIDLIKYRNKLKKTDDAMYRTILPKSAELKTRNIITCENIKINMTANSNVMTKLME